MRALLNSLGLTIWSSIAIVLAVGVALVGYRVTMSMKDSPQTAALAVGVASPPPAPLLPLTSSLEKVTPLMHGQKFSRVIEPQMRAAEAALQAGRWHDVLDNAQTAERKQGITVFDTKTINHFKAYAHLQLHNSSAALTDFERVLATGAATPDETALISKTISALQARIEWDKNSLPLPEAAAPSPEAAASVTADRPPQLVAALPNETREALQQTVEAITRGLRKGSIAHLDEAYVYLGLAEQRLGNIAEARRAFAQLKSVPNISPRILKLWTLYADTLASQAPTADSGAASREPEVAASVTAPASEPTPMPAWVEGRNYRLLSQPVTPSLPRGKVLVTEVFSYACTACNHLQPHMQRLIDELPSNTVVNYVPAAWPSPVLQHAYVTAQVLGVADKAHDAMFKAVWSSGELASINALTGAPRSTTIEDAAEFYQKRAGVSAATFLETSRSFAVDVKVQEDEGLVKAYGIDAIPAIVINGKYVTDARSAGGAQPLIDLVVWLVAMETPAPAQASLSPPDARH